MTSSLASIETHPIDASIRQGYCGTKGVPLLLLIALALAAVPASGQQGIIEFDNPRHYFGVIQEGEIARHVFTFTNTGEVPFGLTSVEASCACTQTQWTFDSVEPGEQGRIVVEFDSEGRRGTFEYPISVESTAAPGRVDLYITGRIEPRALARGDTLGSLLFGGFRTALPLVKPGDLLAHPILIKNIGEQPIEIRETRTDADHVRVELPKNEIDPGEFIEINVAFVTSEMVPGPFGHRIELHTTDPLIPVKRIRLMGLIR